MNVLIDRHHAGLFHAMQMLFEDRLGMTVYTPVGHDWWDEHYWEFGKGYGDDRLAVQFLMSPQSFYDGHYPGRLIRGVTLAGALVTDWGYVVATVQDNQHGLKRFADEVGAQFVLQVGNTNQDVDWRLDPLALVSSEVPIRGRGLIVHQEFDSEGLFGYSAPVHRGGRVASFVNCFRSTPCIRWFDETAVALPGWRFDEYGIDGQDGNIQPISDIAAIMREATFGWHDKVQGDGFGHVIHMWAAVGRPIVGHSSHYHGLTAAPFWSDLVTCIDLDRHSTEEVAHLMREIVADPPRHEAMCRAIRAKFDELVDYDAEASSVRDFLGLPTVTIGQGTAA